MKKRFKKIRRLIVLLLGGALLFIGIVMIVLPGPALIVIPVSLAILGTEFEWAQKLLGRIKNIFKKKEAA